MADNTTDRQNYTTPDIVARHRQPTPKTTGPMACS